MVGVGGGDEMLHVKRFLSCENPQKKEYGNSLAGGYVRHLAY